MGNNETELQRLIITSSLLGAAYVAWNCPCDTIPSCHLTQFLTLAGFPIAYALYINRDMLFSESF